jgi:ATP-dependent DNA helicase PIF1
MCIRNLNLKRGIINGTLMEIVAIGTRHIQCRVLTGKATGSIEYLLKNAFTITPEASGLPFTVLRRQYPIIPAYCLTVHKAQGQTIHKCGLIFESDPYTHGQLYVALSRVSSWDSLYVSMHAEQTEIRNVVLQHLLV